MAEEQQRRYKCDCAWHEGHIIFRVVLAIVVLLIVFWMGVEMGSLREAYSLNGLNGFGGYGYGDYGYHRMMYGYGADGSAAPGSVQTYVTPYGVTTTPPAAQ